MRACDHSVFAGGWAACSLTWPVIGRMVPLLSPSCILNLDWALLFSFNPDSNHVGECTWIPETTEAVNGRGDFQLQVNFSAISTVLGVV